MCLRKFIIFLSITSFFLIFLSTEIFSLLNILNQLSIRIFWLFVVIISISIIIKKKYFKKIVGQKLRLTPEIFFILVIFIFTFINAVIYAPNTLDAMTYHMTKVMNWIQNENLNFYPTNDLRELILAPLSEYIILHLYIVAGGDYFANLVQWHSMFVSCLGVSLIAKELNCNSKYQTLAALFCASIPMGIMQSTSTQTDYVTTMWIVLMVYFLLKFIRQNKLLHLIFFSVCLGLGVLTKGTFYFFALPFCVWLGWYLAFTAKKIYLSFVIVIIFLIINSGHFFRNINLYNNPLGISDETPSWINETLNIDGFSSNIIKNLSLNLSLPNKEINKLTNTVVEKIHKYLDVLPGDPKTTMGGQGYYIPFSFYESTAPNTLHFVIIIFLVIFFILQKNKKKAEILYFLSIVFGFLIFSFLVKWMPQGNRILLTSFVLLSPYVALMISKIKLKNFGLLISTFLFIYSLPYLFFNKSRPLISKLEFNEKGINFKKPDFISLNRDELYYVADKYYHKRDLYRSHIDIIKKIKDNRCRIIGLDNYMTNDLQYPFWNILIKELKHEKFNIYNVNVRNKSKIYTDLEKMDKICAIVHKDRIEFKNL
jgi:uncharacterized protein YeeX (DUF496 family)